MLRARIYFLSSISFIAVPIVITIVMICTRRGICLPYCDLWIWTM